MSPYDENWNLDAPPRDVHREWCDSIGAAMRRAVFDAFDRKRAELRAVNPRSPRA